MGRKSREKTRKTPTAKVQIWLAKLLIDLQDQDLRTLTMDDFVRISGRSKSTFYTYFEKKEDVLMAACQTRIDSIFSDLNAIDFTAYEVSDLYRELIEVFASGTAGIRLGFLQTIRDIYPGIWQQIEVLTDAYVGLLKGLYERGMESGLYNQISVELLTSMDRMFVIELVTNTEIFTDKKYTVSDLVRDYLNLRLNGLLKPS
jgi:AcrR family transcriptional regulator